MKTETVDTSSWIKEKIKPSQINKYLINGEDFIKDDKIESKRNPLILRR